MWLCVVNLTIIDTSKQACHVAPGVTLERVKSRLADVRGHLVEHPLDFLIEETVRSMPMGCRPRAYRFVGPLGQRRLDRTQPRTSCLHLNDKCTFLGLRTCMVKSRNRRSSVNAWVSTIMRILPREADKLLLHHVK